MDAKKVAAVPRRIKQSAGDWAFDVFNYILMAVLILIMVYPLWYVLIASFSDPLAIKLHSGLLFWVKGSPSVMAYELVFKNPMITSGYANTIFYVVAGTALNVILTTIAAYVLSRKQFMFRNPIMLLITFTMFFNGGMIPTFLLVQRVGLYNNPLAMILPTAISAYNLIIMRTNLLAMPVSLEESARLDGARDVTIIFRIVIPLSMPIISVMILFYGVEHWNAWFNAMIYLRDRKWYPLQLVLREILIGTTQESLLSDVIDDTVRPGLEQLVRYATVIIATVPVLCIYPVLQKYFVKGVMVGAIKE